MIELLGECQVGGLVSRSFWLDMKILVMTARQTLKLDGISPPGRAAAKEFKGR